MGAAERVRQARGILRGEPAGIGLVRGGQRAE